LLLCVSPFVTSAAVNDLQQARLASLTAGLRGWAAQGDLEKVASLLDEGADVLADNNYGITPLHAAAEKGHSDMIIMLLRRGARADMADINGLTPLHYAALFKQPAAIDALIESNNISAAVQDAYRQRPLHLAAKSGCVLCAERLLQIGAEVNCRDEVENTPLTLAAFGHHVDLALQLLDAGADINAQDQEGNSALHWAARGHWQLSAHLLSQGANPKLVDGEGRTPADWAREEDSLALTDLFEAFSGKPVDAHRKHWITEVEVR